MTKKAVTLIVLIMLGGGVAYLLSATDDQPGSQRAAIGGRAPDFELTDTEGKTWKLSDLKGKIVLINFWASWCDPCKDEIPSIQNLLNSEKGNDKLVFLSILYRDDPAQATSYLKERGFGFPVLLDTRNVASSYGVTGVPETFVIDKSGIVKDKIIGPQKWDTPEVRAALAKLIGNGRS
jgi:peroxiredoxin